MPGFGGPAKPLGAVEAVTLIFAAAAAQQAESTDRPDETGAQPHD